MREGTATKTSEQISEQLDRLAASVGVGAGLSSPSASVTGSGLTNNLDTVLALMADVLLHPSFPQDGDRPLQDADPRRVDEPARAAADSWRRSASTRRCTATTPPRASRRRRRRSMR